MAASLRTDLRQVILDIFSRQVVGWMLAELVSADLAEQLIADTVSRHDV